MLSRFLFFKTLTNKLPTNVTKNINFLSQIRQQELRKEIAATEKMVTRSEESLNGLSLFWQATHNRCYLESCEKLANLKDEYKKLNDVLGKKRP